jgi:hypothetical protein
MPICWIAQNAPLYLRKKRAKRDSAETVKGTIARLTARLNTHQPQLPSRPPSTHTPWSRRGSGRPGRSYSGALHLDALGRVCSALPGSTVDGMGAPRARSYGPAVGNGAPSIPVPADPPPEALS